MYTIHCPKEDTENKKGKRVIALRKFIDWYKGVELT